MRFLHLCGFGLLFDGCLNVAYLLVQPTNMGFERTLDHRVRTMLQVIFISLWVLNPLFTSLDQPPPDELARPGSAVGALGKTYAALRAALDDRIGTTSFLKEAKHPLYSTANLVIGIKDNATFIVITQANWQGKPQFPLLCFVKLTALEAPAQKV